MQCPHCGGDGPDSVDACAACGASLVLARLELVKGSLRLGDFPADFLHLFVRAAVGLFAYFLQLGRQPLDQALLFADALLQQFERLGPAACFFTVIAHHRLGR